MIARVTGELADLAETAAVGAAAVLRNRRRALSAALSGPMRGRLRQALDELAVTMKRTATIVAQTRSRLAGQLPDSAIRLVCMTAMPGRSARGAPAPSSMSAGFRRLVKRRTGSEGWISHLKRGYEWDRTPAGRPRGSLANLAYCQTAPDPEHGLG